MQIMNIPSQIFVLLILLLIVTYCVMLNGLDMRVQYLYSIEPEAWLWDLPPSIRMHETYRVYVTLSRYCKIELHNYCRYIQVRIVSIYRI